MTTTLVQADDPDDKRRMTIATTRSRSLASSDQSHIAHSARIGSGNGPKAGVNVTATATGRDAPHATPIGSGPADRVISGVTGQTDSRATYVGSGDPTDRSGEVTGDEQERLAVGFGRRIVELRAAAGLTQREAAMQAHISERNWRRLERGERRASPDLIALMSFVLSADDGRRYGGRKYRGIDPGRDPFIIVDELLALGGTSITGNGRRRFRAETRRQLAELVNARMYADQATRDTRRMLRAADDLERRGAGEIANSMRRAAQYLQSGQRPSEEHE